MRLPPRLHFGAADGRPRGLAAGADPAPRVPGLACDGMDFLNEVNSRESHEFWTAMRDGTASKQMIVDYFR